jgi:hypothetical protein
MRNTGGGVDTIPAANPYSVKSYMVKGGDSYTTWTGYVDQAISKNGMIVFLFHNIRDTGSGNTVSKANASKLFEYVGNMQKDNKVWSATYEEAILYTHEYDAASATVRQDDNGIYLTVTDNLDDDIYNYALSVRVEIVEAGWDKVLQTNPDGSTEILTVMNDKNGAYVMASAVPDAGDVVLTKLVK